MAGETTEVGTVTTEQFQELFHAASESIKLAMVGVDDVIDLVLAAMIGLIAFALAICSAN